MNPFEVRLDNLIQLYRKPEDKEKSIHRIKSIVYLEEEQKYFFELRDGFLVNCDTGVEPIPLADPKILKRLGFEYFSAGAGDHYNTWRRGSFEIIADFDVIKTITWEGKIEFEFVHQLQNFYYAYTGGYELELKAA